jgi:hypothetical protein
MSENGEIQRSILPIPDRPHVRVEATQPFIFSADEGVDIGCETGSAVTPECDVKRSAFTGEIKWVELKLGDDDHSHLLDPEEHINMLMGRQ